MKYKLLFVMMFTASMLFTNTEAQTIFDPATYDPGDLPAGMTIVDIGGTSYCQIILDGWGSVIDVDDVIITDEVNFKVMAKMALGTATGDTLVLADVNTFLKLANFRTTPNVEICAVGAGSTADFAERIVDIAIPDTVTGVQIAGQINFGSWGTVTGDTLWIGAMILTPSPAVNMFHVEKNISAPNIIDTNDFRVNLNMTWDADNIYLGFNVLDDTNSVASTPPPTVASTDAVPEALPEGSLATTVNV